MTAWAGLFQEAFRQSRNPMFLIDSDRRLVDLNGAWLRLLGYRRQEMIGQPLFRFVAGPPQFTPAEWERQLAIHKYTGEGLLRTADGQTVAAQYAATTETVTGRKLVLGVTLTTRARPRRTLTPSGKPLTDREREVVRLVALGYTAREIADELDIAHDTVRTHVSNAMEKVGARSRAQLVAKALGEGLVL